jgi:hypothetical protein
MPFKGLCSGKNPAEVFLFRRAARFAPEDREKIFDRIAEGSDGDRGRSKVVSHLLAGSIRLKGVNPKVGRGGVIAPHFGPGNVSHRVVIAEDASLVTVPGDLNPEGTMFFDNAEREAETALKLGQEITDEVLGLGSYDGFSFQGRKVGFVIFGLPSADDCRLQSTIANLMLNFIGRVGDPAAVMAIFPLIVNKIGRLMKGAHDRELVHLYPHLGNFRLDFQVNNFPEFKLDPESTRLVDLETAKDTSALPAEIKAAWRYRDLSRLFADLALMRFGARFADLSLPLEKYLPDFFDGYLGEREYCADELVAGAKCMANDYVSLERCRQQAKIQLFSAGAPRNVILGYLLAK